MKKIKSIEIRDSQKEGESALVKLPQLLSKIENPCSYSWGILFFDAMYYSEKAKPIAGFINDEIIEKKIIHVNWEQVKILSTGVGQFLDLVLIGCKDKTNLKYYNNDNEMIKNCDLVIINFDGCWWEISCKNDAQLQKYIDSFKKVTIIKWNDSKSQ